MKKISTILFSITSSVIFAQCEIIGKSNINVGEKESYSVTGSYSQCEQCHHWASQGNANIITDNRLNNISINPIKEGNAKLSIEYLSDSGLIKCHKDIVISNKENINNKENIDSNECDIDVTDYEEIEITKDRLAFMDISGKGYNHNWEVTYKNGQKSTSNDNSPQFINYKDNPIKKVTITVKSNKCHKKFTISY